MPIVLNTIERLGLLWLNKGPGPMLDLVGALAARTLAAAVKLNVFEILREEAQSAADVARTAGADERGIGLLLDALESLGYLKKNRGRYVVSAMSRAWMCADSPQSMVGLVRYFNDALERWNYLDESIRLGNPPDVNERWLRKHPEAWKNYHEGMRGIARLVGDAVVDKVRLPGPARRLLDVGGSHGLYSIKFCRRYPGIEAEILDWELARETALETIAAENMTGRVRFRQGDFDTDTFNDRYDVILMFNFIRIYNPDNLVEVLRKASGLLAPGGMLVVMDQFGHERASRFVRANHALILLELFNVTPGRTYTMPEAAECIRQAGFSRQRKFPLRRSAGLGVIAAVK